MAHPDQVAKPSPGRGRMYGLDVARAAAIVGMIAVHVRPIGAEDSGADLVDALLLLPNGRASILFVVLAGIGVSFILKPDKTGSRRIGTLLWRAGLLHVLGLALQPLDHGVAVILQLYGLLFVLAPFLTALSTRWLLAGAAFFSIAGPLIFIALSDWIPESPHMPQFGDSPTTIVAALLLTGQYPLVTWIVPYLVGIALGRFTLSDRGVQLKLTIAGCAIAPVMIGLGFLFSGYADDDAEGLAQLALGTPHSQMPLWLIEGVATSCLVIALALAVERKLGQHRRLLWPAAAFGQLAFTIYIGHLFLIAGVLRPLGAPETAWGALAILVLFVAACLVIAPLWLSVFRFGPAEYLMQLPRFIQQWRHNRGNHRDSPPERTRR